MYATFFFSLKTENEYSISYIIKALYNFYII